MSVTCTTLNQTVLSADSRSTSVLGKSRMPAQAANLYLPQDLVQSVRASGLATSDRSALSAVADWIQTFVAAPHKDLGRVGPVCPFVPGSLARQMLWLAPERVSSQSIPDVVQLVDSYKKLFLRTQPTQGDDAAYKAIVIVFTDSSADRAKAVADSDQMQQLRIASYVDDGVVLGDFHANNDGAAIRNPNFRPFRSPVPFLLLRHAVISDWMFFLDNDEWLGYWTNRFGATAVQTLAKELRGTNWRRLES